MLAPLGRGLASVKWPFSRKSIWLTPDVVLSSAIVYPVVFPLSTFVAAAIFAKSPELARTMRVTQPVGGGGPPTESNPTPPFPLSQSEPLSSKLTLFQFGLTTS